jgi:HK97 gp10 family phage protein
VKISVKITSNKLPTIAQRLPQGAHDALAASLTRVQEGASRRSRVDTGELRDSWAVAFTGPTDGEVFSDSDHAVYNEFGTVNMTAQPMLRPAIDEERPRYVAALANLISDLG